MNVMRRVPVSRSGLCAQASNLGSFHIGTSPIATLQSTRWGAPGMKLDGSLDPGTAMDSNSPHTN